MMGRTAISAVVLLLLSMPLFETSAVTAQEAEWKNLATSQDVDLESRTTESKDLFGKTVYKLEMQLKNRNPGNVRVEVNASWEIWNDLMNRWDSKSYKSLGGIGRELVLANDSSTVYLPMGAAKDLDKRPRAISGTIKVEKLSPEIVKKKEPEGGKGRPADEQQKVKWTTHSSHDGVDFQYSLTEDKLKGSTLYYYNFRFVNNNQYEVRVAAEVTWEVWVPGEDGRGEWQAKNWERKGIHKMLIEKQREGKEDNCYMNSLNEGGAGSSPRKLKVVSVEVSKTK